MEEKKTGISAGMIVAFAILIIIDIVLFVMILLPKSNETKPEVQTSVNTETAAVSICGSEAYQSPKYTLYIGLNDKDKGEQLIDTDIAADMVNKICAKYAGGYTRMSAAGGWTGDSGEIEHENTLVYMLYDVEEDAVKNIMDDAIKALNQSSILVEKETAVYSYYSTAA